jgi:hypothetical protein
MERTQLATGEPEWKKAPVAMPLNQAFPEFDQVREYRSKQCIFNHDRSRLFNVVSRKYQVIEHPRAVDVVQSALNQVFGGNIEPTVRSIEHGARIRAEWQLESVVDMIEVAKGDLIRPTLVMRNSYDGMWKFSATLGAFRLVCSNGMVIGQKFGSISGKHFPVIGKPDEFPAMIEKMVKNGALLQAEWREWNDQEMSLEEAEQLVDDWLPKKYKVPLLQAENFPKTKWQFYNDLTYISTHQTKSVTRRIEFDDIIASLFYRGITE